MRLTNYLSDIFSENKLNILRYFYMFQDGSFTGRYIAQYLKMNHKTCLSLLNELCDIGILKKEVVGKAHLFSVIESFYWNNVLVVLFEKETKLISSIKKEIVKQFSKECVKIILFGSYAIKEETITSDFDVCFIYKDKEEELRKKLERYTGKFYDIYLCHLSPYIISEECYKKGKTQVIKDINQYGTVIYA